MSYILLLVVALVVAFNAHASMVAIRSKLSDRRQKTAQLLLIWLVPVLGAFLTTQALKGSSRNSWFGRGDAGMEPEQAWLGSGQGDDCSPGNPGCGE